VEVLCSALHLSEGLFAPSFAGLSRYCFNNDAQFIPLTPGEGEPTQFMKRRYLIFPLLAFVCAISFLSASGRSSDGPPPASAFLSAAENEILAEMNLARTQPQQYAAYVEEFKKYYKGQRLLLPGSRPIVTNEGLSAVEEAITFLRAAKPLPALEPAEPACLAARDHAADMIKNGIVGHIGSDGTKPNDRVDRYGKWLGAIGEAIVYQMDTPRHIVIGMIIDDGTKSRGHRNDLFSENYKVAGLSISEQNAGGQICVIDYVGGFSKKAAPATTRQ
jgi:uncharacterized protein YkwD